MERLIAFHGKSSVKQKYLDRVKKHAAADDIIKGTYGSPNGASGWRGCGIGCTIHGSTHANYETELGIPETIARLEDTIFEGLPEEKSKDWPVKFLESIKPGADLEMVWPKFAGWLMLDKSNGVLRLAKTEQSKSAIESVGALCTEWVETGIKPDAKRFRKASAAAADAAYAAAAVTDAASAYAGARHKFWVAASKKLLSLLAAAPQTESTETGVPDA